MKAATHNQKHLCHAHPHGWGTIVNASTGHRPPDIHVQNDAAVPQLKLKQKAAIWKGKLTLLENTGCEAFPINPLNSHIKTKRQVLLLQVRVQSESLCACLFYLGLRGS